MVQSKHALCISILVHTLIFLALAWALHSYSLKRTSHSIVNAYFVQSEMTQNHLFPAKSAIAKASPMQRAVIPTKVGIQPSEAGALDSRLRGDDKPAIVETMRSPSTSEINTLLQIVASNIQHNLHYPHLAQTHIQQGQSLLQFDLNPQGDLQNIQVVQSSGVAVLDEAAKQAIQASSPIHIPDAIRLPDIITLRLPVNFKLQV